MVNNIGPFYRIFDPTRPDRRNLEKSKPDPASGSTQCNYISDGMIPRRVVREWCTDPYDEGDLRTIVVHVLTSTNLPEHRLEERIVASRSGLVSQPLARVTHRQACLAAVEMEVGRLEKALATRAEVHVALQTQTILWHL